MASYEELYNMVVNESMKGSIGRAGLKAIDSSKKVYSHAKGKYDSAKDKMQSAKDKIQDSYNKAKSDDGIKGSITRGAEKTVKGTAGVITYPVSKTADIAANTITKGKEIQIKKKYSGNPEKMEAELKKNVEKVSELKSDIMALTIWAAGWPLALKSAGILDNVLKGIMGAGAIARNDRELELAVAKATVWAPVAAAKLSKIIGKEVTGDKALSTIKEITNKIVSTLKNWAESDKPLMKKQTVVSESTDDFIPLSFLICESVMNEEMTLEEASDMLKILEEINYGDI